MVLASIISCLSIYLSVPWFVGCFGGFTEDSSFEPSHQLDQVTPISCVRLCALNER